MCFICAQTLGACVVDGIVMIALRFRLGQVLPDFGETGIDIVVWLPGDEVITLAVAVVCDIMRL